MSSEGALRVDRPNTLQTNERSLSGWGGRPRSTSRIITPDSADEITAGDLPPGRGMIARGLGRSYGDAAQVGGGTVVDMTRLAGVQLDAGTGIVVARAGTSLGDVLEVSVPSGWFLPVTPGTRHVTVGGAIAADVHGKNHHRDGSFGHHIESLQLITGDGRTIATEPGDSVYSATLGGMGLTGIITMATFRLIPIETPWMSVDTTRADDLAGVMHSLSETDTRHRYSVAWVDLTRHGRGRGIVMGGDHARMEEVDTRRGQQERSGTVRVPAGTPGLINDLTVSLFNRMWFAMAPRHESGRIRSLASFFYPLDAIIAWNNLYGDRGFLQYQFVVPFGAESTLLAVSETLARTATPVSLAVLKRMGKSSGGQLSFPMPGWTLSVDMPLGDADLAGVLERCDERITMAGGRVYLAKDSRLRPEMFGEMYPGLRPWQKIREPLDPGSTLRSNLSQRLGLTT